MPLRGPRVVARMDVPETEGGDGEGMGHAGRASLPGVGAGQPSGCSVLCGNDPRKCAELSGDRSAACFSDRRNASDQGREAPATARTLSLDGDDWSVREALGDTADWYVGAPLPEAGNNVAEASAAMAAAPGWLPARVPGAVIDDLHRAGEVPDPRVGRNSRASEWAAERSWVYRRAVEVPGEPRDAGADDDAGADADARAADDVAVLEFDGVDPGADVYWDGEHLGRIDGLFHSHRLLLEKHHRTAGLHRLALRVHPAPDSEPQVGRTERVRIHAPRMGYGWDFSPRLRHQGLWRSARIRVGALLLGEVWFASGCRGMRASRRMRTSRGTPRPARSPRAGSSRSARPAGRVP